MFLEKKYFYKLKEGKIEEQGIILEGSKDQSLWECLFFDWIMGDQTYIRLKQISYFDDCLLFESEESRDFWFENYGKKLMPKGEDYE